MYEIRNLEIQYPQSLLWHGTRQSSRGRRPARGGVGSTLPHPHPPLLFCIEYRLGLCLRLVLLYSAPTSADFWPNGELLMAKKEARFYKPGWVSELDPEVKVALTTLTHFIAENAINREGVATSQVRSLGHVVLKQNDNISNFVSPRRESTGRGRPTSFV